MCGKGPEKPVEFMIYFLLVLRMSKKLVQNKKSEKPREKTKRKKSRNIKIAKKDTRGALVTSYRLFMCPVHWFIACQTSLFLVPKILFLGSNSFNFTQLLLRITIKQVKLETSLFNHCVATVCHELQKGCITKSQSFISIKTSATPFCFVLGTVNWRVSVLAPLVRARLVQPAEVGESDCFLKWIEFVILV